MKTLRRMVLVNSADYPYGEVMLTGNTYLDGYNGAGKSSALRGILYFYIADGGSPALNEKGSFKDFYYPSQNTSYLVYEVENSERTFIVFTFKKNNDVKFVFADTPYQREFFLSDDNLPLRSEEVRRKLSQRGIDYSNELNPETFKKVLWGNSDRDLREYRKFNLVSASRYDEMARIIQNSFLMNKIEGEDIKRILTSVGTRDNAPTSINLSKIRESLGVAMKNMGAIEKWFSDPFGYPAALSTALETLTDVEDKENTLGEKLDRARCAYALAKEFLGSEEEVIRRKSEEYKALQKEISEKEKQADATLAELNQRMGALAADLRIPLMEIEKKQTDEHTRVLSQLQDQEAELERKFNNYTRDLSTAETTLNNALRRLDKATSSYERAGEDIRKTLDSLHGSLSEQNDRLEQYDKSTIGWLDKNVKGWRENIGRVVSEDVLYMDSLSPALSKKGGDSLYGVDLDLGNIQQDLDTKEMLLHEVEKTKEEISLQSEKYAKLTLSHEEEMEGIRSETISKISASLPGFTVKQWTKEGIDALMSKLWEDLETRHNSRSEEYRKARADEQEKFASWRSDFELLKAKVQHGELTGVDFLDRIEALKSGQIATLAKEIETTGDALRDEIEGMRDDLSHRLAEIGELQRTTSKLYETVDETQIRLKAGPTFFEEPGSSFETRAQDFPALFQEYLDARNDIARCKDEIRKLTSRIRTNFAQSDIFYFTVDDTSSESEFNDEKKALLNISEMTKDDAPTLIRTTISEIYIDVIKTVRNYADDFLRKKEEVRDIIRRINRELASNTYVKAIRKLELRQEDNTNALVKKITEIQRFCADNNFSPEDINIFTDQGTFEDLSNKAKDHVKSLGRLLEGEFSEQKSLSLSEMFDIKFDITENGNVHRSERSINKIGSDGTDKMAKILINISMLSALMGTTDRRNGEFRLHCAIDETGQIDDNNITGLVQFANSKNIGILNASPKITDTQPYEYIYRVYRDELNRVFLTENLRNITSLTLEAEGDSFFQKDEDIYKF